MEARTQEEVAESAGVEPAFVDELVRTGILKPNADGSFTPGGARATRVVRDLVRAGLPVDGIARVVAAGTLDFGLFDLGNYDRIAALMPETFRQVAGRTGIPLSLLLVIREAIGFAVADPDDRMREDEWHVLPFIEAGVAGGLPPAAMERVLRVLGDSLRRVVDSESEAWLTHVLQPLIASGMPAQRAMEIGSKFGEANMHFLDEAILAIHRGHQSHVWMNGTYQWVEEALEEAGLRERVVHPPAMCFLDLSGYTRLTEERGDRAAADLALALSQLVQRTAHEHRGRVVKWLGDGVMLYFDLPADALVGSVEMAERVPAAGLPPAHVGVDAGPVIIQDGDYFGGTVNGAARIAAYAKGGEVLASERAVRSGALPDGIRSTGIGAAELKGFSRPLELSRIERVG